MICRRGGTIESSDPFLREWTLQYGEYVESTI